MNPLGYGFVEYWVPNEDGTTKVVIRTIEEAVRVQREHVRRVHPDFKGYDGPDGDEEALADYVAVNWAFFVGSAKSQPEFGLAEESKS